MQGWAPLTTCDAFCATAGLLGKGRSYDDDVLGAEGTYFMSSRVFFRGDRKVRGS